MLNVATALLVFSLSYSFVSARSGGPSRLERDVSGRQHKGSYALDDMYKPEDFLNKDKWEYFSAADPTHGTVNYLTHDEATGQGLAKVDDGAFVLAVDNKAHLNPDNNDIKRNSVRISSTKKYTTGLIIADFKAMPFGCSVWPAWWMVGRDWPNNGEIDIVEGVNMDDTNQMTLHTKPGCNVAKDARMSGKVLGDDCDVTGGKGNSGCGVKDSDHRSYGKGFNDVGGGVFATLIESDGIKIWHFARDEIPEDIKSHNPNPSSWPKQAAFFPNSQCDTSDHFQELALTLNIALCGDWAGNAFKDADGCKKYPTCQAAVADPSNFDDAKFIVNYVATYKLN